MNRRKFITAALASITGLFVIKSIHAAVKPEKELTPNQIAESLYDEFNKCYGLPKGYMYQCYTAHCVYEPDGKAMKFVEGSATIIPISITRLDGSPAHETEDVETIRTRMLKPHTFKLGKSEWKFLPVEFRNDFFSNIIYYRINVVEVVES